MNHEIHEQTGVPNLKNLSMYEPAVLQVQIKFMLAISQLCGQLYTSSSDY